MESSIQTCHDAKVTRRSYRAAHAVVCAGALFGAFACGDSGPGVRSIPDDGAFDPKSLDFGAVAVGETAGLPVVMRNLSADGIRIQEVRFDPPTDAYAARQADGSTLRGAFIARGGKLELQILFAPVEAKDYSGTMIVGFVKTHISLPIKASGRAVAPAMPVVEPSTVTFLDTEIGRDVVRTIEVKNTGESPAVLREVRPKSMSPSEPFSISARGGGPAAPSAPIAGRSAQTLVLEVHFLPLSVGSFHEDIEIVFDGGTTTTLFVSGSAVQAGLLQCDLPQIAFGQVPRGTTARKDVHCAVTGGAYALQSIGFSSTSSRLFQLPNPPTALAPNQTLDFTVAFQSNGLPDRYVGTLEITAAHGAVTRIPLSAEVVPPPAGSTDLLIILTWSTRGTDFDLHLTRNGANPFDPRDDCYYGHKNPTWGAPGDAATNPVLDQDNTDGTAPEQITLITANDDIYDIYVHFYNYSAAQPPPSDTLTVRFQIRGGPVQTYMQTVSTCGSTWHVGKLHMMRSPPAFEPDSAVTDQWRSRAAARCQ